MTLAKRGRGCNEFKTILEGRRGGVSEILGILFLYVAEPTQQNWCQM